MSDPVYADGFESYLTADLPMRYTVTGAPVIASNAGRNGTGCVKLNGIASGIERAFPATDTFSMLVAFYVEAIANYLFMYPVGNSSTAAFLTMNLAGTIAANVNGLTATSAPVSVGTWNTLEIQLKIADAGGYAKMRLNGVEFMNATGDTKNSTTATASSIRILTNNTALKMWFDDLVIAYGGAQALAYIGDMHVSAHVINGAGDATMLTKGGSVPAATNWESVDDAAPNGDVDYVYSGTPNDKDLYALTDPGIAGNLFALQITSIARKDDATTRVFRNLLKSGGTEYESGDHGAPSGYQAFSDCWLTNPATGLPWTSATRPQVGVKVTV